MVSEQINLKVFFLDPSFMASPDSDVETPQGTPTMSSPADKLIVLNVGSQLCIKFDGDNYPAWRIQFIDLLTGYDLMSYVDGSKPCPSKVLENNTTTVNPVFTHWVQQDQLILHSIISSVTAIAATHLGTVKTFNKAWEILKTMYVGLSRVRVMTLKQKIPISKKEINPWLNAFKELKPSQMNYQS